MRLQQQHCCVVCILNEMESYYCASGTIFAQRFGLSYLYYQSHMSKQFLPVQFRPYISELDFVRLYRCFYNALHVLVLITYYVISGLLLDITHLCNRSTIMLLIREDLEILCNHYSPINKLKLLKLIQGIFAHIVISRDIRNSKASNILKTIERG